MSETKTTIQQLEKRGNPLIEGNRASIYWRGSVSPDLRCDLTNWEDGEAVQLIKVKKNLWFHEFELPADAYIEYAFFRDGKRVPDPLNPKVTPNGLGAINHFFGMPDYKPTEWIQHNPNIPHGKVFSARLPTENYLDGSWRKAYFYQPPVDKPVPLIVVYDGREYHFRARLTEMLDNLIAANRIEPVALAMVENSENNRSLEYSCSESCLLFVGHILLPFASQRLNLLNLQDHPGTYGIVGASLGGLMAFYTALRFPNIFGNALLQSGAFSIHNYDYVVWDLVKNLRKNQLNIWMDCGKYEMLREVNRNMSAVLEKRGCKFIYHEYSGGHNFPSWRDDLPHGLEHLFGIKPGQSVTAG